MAPDHIPLAATHNQGQGLSGYLGYQHIPAQTLHPLPAVVHWQNH